MSFSISSENLSQVEKVAINDNEELDFGFMSSFDMENYVSGFKSNQ